MYFCTLNYLTQRFDSDKRSVPRTMLIGATARTTATVCLIPFSVLKTRFEVIEAFIS